MPRYPGAHWRPINGHTDGPMRAHLGAVLHVNQSNGNLFNWFNGPHDVSAHFEVYKSGAVEQYLDTAVTSWCQMDGNGTYVSIETEGYDREPLNRAQILALAKLLAWLHTTHGIPLQLADKPGVRGFGWHGMGGAAWGGHTGCPGELRKAQRPEILKLAGELLNAPAPPPPPPRPAPAPQPAKPQPADGYPYRLYTVAGGKGPVYAAAPGRWRRVDAFDVAVLIAHGEASPTIHRVRPTTLARLRAVAIGANT